MSAKKISLTVIVALAVMGMGLTYATASVISIQQAMPPISRQLSSGGSIVALNVGIYSDQACTQTLQSIDWGQLTPGDSVTRTIYIKNIGNSQLTLYMTTNNWNPTSANGPLKITWDREGATVDPGQTTQTILTLTVAQNTADITNFSVTIVISGTPQNN
jgi:hypothetical protein